MKTTFAIVLVMLVVGLAAGVVVPHEQPAAASLAVSAEQPIAEASPNRIAYSRARGAIGPAANDAAFSDDSTTPVLAPQPGVAVPLADALGVAGLLGAAIVTVVLLHGGRPDAAPPARPPGGEVPRQQP